MSRGSMVRAGRSVRLSFLCAVLAFGLPACASHSDRLKEMRSALDANRPAEALEHLNEELGVDSEKELPDSLGGDRALLLLDRAMILHQLRRYELSSRDLQVADKQVEILDLSRNAAHEIGKYLFSDDVGPYKAPAYEKLLVNTINMVNYLVRGDLNGARVEARRLAVMQKYLSERRSEGAAMLGPGSYLAGFTFEKSGRADEALRYYDEALAYGSYESLAEPVSRLMQSSGYRSPRLRAIAAKAVAATSNASASASTDGAEGAVSDGAGTNGSEEDAEILVLVSYGRVPPKIAKRVPIGLALTYASGALSPTDHARANQLAAQGLVTWVNYPELGRARGTYETPGFALDGAWAELEAAVAIDREAKRAWDEARGAIVAGAITRMLTRVVAGEAVRRTANDSVIGTLLSLGVQATLTATDTPDTRSWSTLPARIAIGRARVKPGVHYVDLVARGVRSRQKLTLAAGGWAVAAHTVLF